MNLKKTAMLVVMGMSALAAPIALLIAAVASVVPFPTAPYCVISKEAACASEAATGGN